MSESGGDAEVDERSDPSFIEYPRKKHAEGRRSFPVEMVSKIFGDMLFFFGEGDMGVEPKIDENSQIIHLFIGFSIIFTIHFGVPLFLEIPIYIYVLFSVVHDVS